MKKLKVPFDTGDVFVFASLIFIFYGMYLIKPAYAFLTVGGIMLILGIAMVWATAGTRGDDG